MNTVALLLTTEQQSTQRSEQAIDRVMNYWRLEEAQRQVHQIDHCITGIEELDGLSCHYEYDSHQQLTQIRDMNGHTEQFEYDSQMRLTQVIHDDGGRTQYDYNADDRLQQICDRDLCYQFRYDVHGRLIQSHKGDAGSTVYRYDNKGNVLEARTAIVSTQYEYSDRGQITQLIQIIDGIALTVQFHYDAQNRLTQLQLPNVNQPLKYTWDQQNWLQSVAWGDRPLATITYDRPEKITQIHYENGIIETSQADPIDARPWLRQVNRGSECLWQQQREYFPSGQVEQDGEHCYEYDRQGRLIAAKDLATGQQWNYHYDDRDNLIHDQNQSINSQSDHFGRIRYLTTPTAQRIYRYNDAHQLIQVLNQGNAIAAFTYDAKGHLVLSRTESVTERYVYGSDDQLLLVTNELGHPLRSYVRTPLGLLAELHLESETIFYRHQDDQGTSRLVTNEQGEVYDRFVYSPYGQPLSQNQLQPIFTGHPWHTAVQFYDCGARWYDPKLARFITTDSYTGAPDDERIVNPFTPASQQLFARAEILATWLKYPRVRNRHTYCQNDPINRVDPNGHWSFGGVLLSILGAIWTLPNTVIGILIEITCLIGEVIRWIVWLFSGGNVSWQTPGFDVASSEHLNAFALVFKGGWLVSAFGMLGITFGNVFFVSKEWDTYRQTLPEPIKPSAYNGTVTIPKEQALYEHELRHTNQYGWFGPFFLLGLPIWGVYIWDAMLHGYYDARLEQDARAHGGI